MLIESAPKCDCGWFPFFSSVCANPTHANCRESRIHHESASIIGDDALLFMMSSIPTGGREAQPRAHRCRERNNFISFFLSLLCLNYLRKHNSRFRQFITWSWGWRKIESLTYCAAVWDFQPEHSERTAKAPDKASLVIHKQESFFSRRHKT